MIFKITEIKEYLNGVLVSFLANKKVENILIKENAGSPKEKKNKAFAELLTLTLSKEPYPNKADVICSEPTIRASDAGKLKNKLNSKALFCNSLVFNELLLLICRLKFGSITVPIAIPAIARFI